jgi:hypothetical protein
MALIEQAPIPERKPNGRKRVRVPESETRREKFMRIAQLRFDRIVHAIHTMRGLGRNQQAYEYGDIDVDRITDLLVAELEAMKAEMKRRGRPTQIKLDLSH